MRELLRKYEVFFTIVGVLIFCFGWFYAGYYFTDAGIDRKDWKAVDRNVDSFEFDGLDLFSKAVFYDKSRDTEIVVNTERVRCTVWYKHELVASDFNKTYSKKVAKKLMKKIPPDIVLPNSAAVKDEFLHVQRTKHVKEE